MRATAFQLIRYLSVPTNKLNKIYPNKMDPQLETFYKKALDLTKMAGKYVFEKISQEKQVEIKTDDVDLVTETDKAVEEMLVEGLGKAFPDHKFIGEETVSGGQKVELTSCPTWIIDPVDGTMNFVHSFPHSCISVSLFMNFNPVIGIIFNPSLNQLFTAVKGNGAFLNGSPIQVSNETKLSKSLLMMEVGTSRDDEKLRSVYNNFTNLVPKIHGVRTLGSCALNMCMVAMGGAEAYFEYGPHIWDIGAGEIIIKEAGGVIMDPKGGQLDRLSRRMLCANNEKIAEELMCYLEQYYPPRD
ncbi:inositol monophosphatase 1-like [Onthophagus taurus]|uniref:inositol monophosphatase 1-like n=1 Tax=Onthophagus taurus TaxID=166361 RepID=UPI000C202BC3|nr:inositol monophosphatase 1-like [Onthophagus taurus]